MQKGPAMESNTPSLAVYVPNDEDVARRLLEDAAKCFGAPIPKEKVRLLASEAGEGRTRLSVIELKQGERSDEWPGIKGALVRWMLRS